MEQILSGILGGVGFMAFYLALHASLPVAGIAAAGAYGAGILIFSKRKKRAELDISETGGLDKEGVDQVIKEGRQKVDRLKSLAQATTAPESRKKVEGLAILAQKIIDDLKEQPGDIKRARQFLNYYLDTTIRILERYTEISGKNVQSAEAAASLQKVESMLDSIHAVFEKQLAGLMQDDILDLDTELTLLQNTLKMEGMTNEK
jgi:5-bromo-4-chloroindolyl phosphate hydrolysis protein